MRLNKNGWSLNEMLLLSGILIIFLLVAVFYISSMYNNFDMEVKKTDYSVLESNLEKQTLIYLNDYYDEMLTSEEITISRSVLRSYNLDVVLEDNKGNSCSGYAKAYKTHGKVYTKAYIKCNGYMTEGYEEWRK
jgi:hypothetical protein